MDGSPENPQKLFSPSLIRPVWADPGYILATNSTQLTDVTLAMGGVARVAPARPDRWAIGFSISAGIIANLTVSPWGDPDAAVAGTLDGKTWLWYTLFDFGPFVAYEWFANFGAAATIRVAEVFIN